MALKTYSRQRKHSQTAYEPPSKRRRISSPDAPFFSDTALTSDITPVEPSSPALQLQSRDDHVPELAIPSSTPPSSPPAPTRSSPSPIVLKRRPTFSFLARKPTKSSSATSNKPAGASPLQPRSVNDATILKRKAATTTTKKHTRLTQLQLDLGSAPVQKTCSTCGMAYVPSNTEDAALHKTFHAQNVGGVELGRSFVRGLTATQRVWEGLEGDCVVAVSRRDGAAAKNRVARVMEVVRAELGAIEIAEAELWEQVEVEAATAPASLPSAAAVVEAHQQEDAVVRKEEVGVEAADSKSPIPPTSKPTSKTSTPTTSSSSIPTPTPAATATASVDRYKAYLYIRGTKCIGLCLAERISSAYHHHDVNSTSHTNATPDLSPKAQSTAPSSSIPTSTTSPSSTPSSSTAVPAHLGISRIWTSSSHRRCGVGSALLNAAAQSFFYGGTVERSAVAFSQPTEAGARLARGWVGGAEQEEGYLVYW